MPLPTVSTSSLLTLSVSSGQVSGSFCANGMFPPHQLDPTINITRPASHWNQLRLHIGIIPELLSFVSPFLSQLARPIAKQRHFLQHYENVIGLAETTQTLRARCCLC